MPRNRTMSGSFSEYRGAGSWVRFLSSAPFLPTPAPLGTFIFRDWSKMTMSSLDTLIQDLVIANRILAKEDVVDAYGHVSVRHPDDPKRFLIARSLAPDLVGPEDIVELDLDGQPLKGDGPALYLERFIHAAIFQARPDVMA